MRTFITALLCFCGGSCLAQSTAIQKDSTGHAKTTVETPVIAPAKGVGMELANKKDTPPNQGNEAPQTEAEKDAEALHFEDSIRNRLAIALTTLDTVHYGVLAMTDNARRKKIKVMKSNNARQQEQVTSDESKDITIQGIDLVIEEWHIMRCFVKTDIGTFQSRYPISLLYYNQGRTSKRPPRRNDSLFFTDLDGKHYAMQIGSVLNFDPSPRHWVSYDNYSISLTKDTATFARSINGTPTADNMINFSVFTDVVGLFGEPNGLVQFEADAYLPINQGNRRNSHLFFMKAVRPYLDLIRMDKEFQVTDVRDQVGKGNSLADTTVPKLFRQAFLIGGVDLNVLSGAVGTNSYNIFGGGEFRQAKILTYDNDKKSANIMTAYAGVNFTTRAFENFRLGADFRWYFWSRLVTSEQYQGTYMQWFISSVNISYFPPFRPQSKMFLRLTYNNVPNFPGSDFMQVQVGYKTPLSSRMKAIQ